MDLQSQKTISLLITITISLDIQIDKFVYHSDLETTILVCFPSKSVNYTAINLFLQKLSTLTIVKFNIYTKTDILLQTNVKFLKAITMCSAFNPDYGYGKSTIILIADVCCPNTKCSGKLCLRRRLFNLSAECPINVRNERLCARGAIFLLKIKQIPFFVVWQKNNIFEENPQSIHDVIGDVYCPGKYCFNKE